MATFTRIEGWEHGQLASNGGGIVQGITGTELSVQSTIKRTGTYALRFNLTSATQTRVQLNVNGGTAVGIIVFSFWLYITSKPSSGTSAITYLYHATNPYPQIRLENQASGGRIYVTWSSGGTTVYGPNLSTGTWHLIDCKFDITNYTIDWQVNSSPQTQSTNSGTSWTVATISIGNNAQIGDWYFDDIVLSSTSGDYPLGGHSVIGIKPSSDGTHVGGTNIIEDNAGTDITSPTYTTANTLINSVPIGNNTAYIKQSGTGTTNYAECNLEDTAETDIRGAMGYLAYMAAGTQSNQGACYLIDEDSNVQEIFGNPTTRTDYSESSVFYKSKIIGNPTGGWDAAAVNALKVRVGNSGDASPVPYWIDVFVQVAYVPVSGTTITPPQAQSASSSVFGTLVKGSVSKTPAQAQAASSAILGTLVKGSLAIVPVQAQSSLSAIAPTAIKGSIIRAPAQAQVAGSLIAPSVVKGNWSKIPAQAQAGSVAIAPIVDTGARTITPAIASMVALLIAPLVVKGSIVRTPTRAESSGSAIAPGIAKGSWAGIPPVANMGYFLVSPEVQISGGDVARRKRLWRMNLFLRRLGL